jgi:hypothetical protein
MCGRNQRLTRKLGRWTSDGAKTAVWWFCPRTESLFKQTPVVVTVTFPLRSSSSRTFTNFLDSLEDKAWIFTLIMIRGSLTVLVDAIHNGTCSCVTDGSFKDTHGTAAWKIVDPAHPEHSFEGQCVTPGTSVQQNSYCSTLRLRLRTR